MDIAPLGATLFINIVASYSLSAKDALERRHYLSYQCLERGSVVMLRVDVAVRDY